MESHRSYHYEPVIQVDGHMGIQPRDPTKKESDKRQDYECDSNSLGLRSVIGFEVDSRICWSCERHARF